MARPCSICGRSDREVIDHALELGESLRLIAARFGICSSSVHRHTKHLHRGQSVEPVPQGDQTAHVLAALENPPISPPPAPLEQPDPEWPNRLTRLSGQPKVETPAQPAALEEQPALSKNNGGRPGVCPVCGSNRWRQLDGHLTCVECHPLPPSPGTWIHTGRTVSEPRAAAIPIRVPIALS